MSLAYTDTTGDIHLVMDFRTAAAVAATLESMSPDFAHSQLPNEREVGARIGEAAAALDAEFILRRLKCEATGTASQS